MKSISIDEIIVDGGEELTIFEIMQRYRSDGSCETLIKRALALLANEATPTKRDYRDLTESFAKILFAWTHPDVLTDDPAITATANGLRFNDYWTNDRMARYVLKSLVAAAMYNRERWGWSDERRKSEKDQQIRMFAEAMQSLERQK